jgi:hypothetical protein
MRDELFKALEARWHKLYDQYEAVKAALPPIVRQEWTNHSRYDPRPFYYQRHYLPRGRVLKQSPMGTSTQSDSYEYGFDAQGRVITERQYLSYLYETFYTYKHDQIEITTFLHYRDNIFLIDVTQCAIKAGRMQYYAGLWISFDGITDIAPIDHMKREHFPDDESHVTPAEEVWAHVSQAQNGIKWEYEEYVYQGRQLTHIREYSRWALSDPFEGEDLIEYDVAGQLQTIIHTAQDGSHHVKYHKRKAGETSTSLRRRAVEKLIEAIPLAIAAKQYTEPLYGLSLGEPIPHGLLPGFESYRQQRLRETSPESLKQGALWRFPWDDEAHKDEPYPPIPITDKETLYACDRLKTDGQINYDHPYRTKIRHEVARALNQLDWSKITPVTADFIVYAVDDIDMTKSLRRSGATKEQLNDWRKRGLL